MMTKRRQEKSTRRITESIYTLERKERIILRVLTPGRRGERSKLSGRPAVVLVLEQAGSQEH